MRVQSLLYKNAMPKICISLYIFFTVNYRSDRPGVQLYLNSTILINSLYDNACNFNK